MAKSQNAQDAKVDQLSTGEGGELIAYVHSLSPIKTSQRNNPYFHMQLQTEKKTFRAVCFSPEKHHKCKAITESYSPIKIANYQMKRNGWTEEEEIHINKRSRLEDADSKEVSFDIKQPTTEENSERNTKPGLSSVESVVEGDINQQVNVCGRLTLQGPRQTILKHEKTLLMQEAALTDETGSIRVVLWENDTNRVTSGITYKLSNVMVREYEKKKYLTLNKNSTITGTDVEIERADDIMQKNSQSKVDCPAEGVQSIKIFQSCNKCQTKIVALPNKNIVKCTECGLTQLKSKCKERLFASVLFSNNVSILVFDDKLRQLHKLFQEQTDLAQEFDVMSDDDIMEMILTVEASIVYNAKRNAVSVTKRA